MIDNDNKTTRNYLTQSIERNKEKDRNIFDSILCVSATYAINQRILLNVIKKKTRNKKEHIIQILSKGTRSQHECKFFYAIGGKESNGPPNGTRRNQLFYLLNFINVRRTLTSSTSLSYEISNLPIYCSHNIRQTLKASIHVVPTLLRNGSQN